MLETIENNAYSHSCICPCCGKRISRDFEERVFYCEVCGQQLHQRAFTDEEVKEALFQHEMDEFED